MYEKIALVTGGVGGIGTAICDRLLAMSYHVVANYHPSESDVASKWQEEYREYLTTTYPADVTDRSHVREMVEWVEHHLGSISVLVNCAGITRDSTLKNMTNEDWDQVIDVNLTGMFNITRLVVQNMIDHKWGRIINISSVNGQQGQFGQCNYSASKAGVHGFTMALTRELAAKGITVKTVSPGYIDTPMTQAIPDSIRNQIVSTIPMGRMGTPEEIAATVSFLVSEDASYITGADISVNGGLRIS